MLRMLVAASGLLVLLAVPASAGKLDNLNSGSSGIPDAPSTTDATGGAAFFASLLPLTSAAMAEDFPTEYADVVATIDAAMNLSESDRLTALADNLVRVSVTHELTILAAPDAANTAVIEGQAGYIAAMLEAEGADVCAPVIFNGSRDLIARGLYVKYAPLIDATMEAYYEAIRQARETPLYLGELMREDNEAVIAQMTAQGDKALMDHFGVMQADSPENCPAILAIIEAANAVDGDSGARVRAAQARGASRL